MRNYFKSIRNLVISKIEKRNQITKLKKLAEEIFLLWLMIILTPTILLN